MIMCDIEQLIDRYLAEGLAPDELAVLSAAVHREGVPDEWIAVRDMIDTLTEGEDDYDLLMAARTAQPKIRRMPFAWRWCAAAVAAIVVGIGVSFYYYRGDVPELAEVVSDTILRPDVQQIAAVRTSHVAEGFAPATAYEAAEAASAETEVAKAPPAEVLAVQTIAITKTKTIAKTIAKTKTKTKSAPEPAEKEQLAEVAVVQRRVYSTNLLDEVPE